MASIHHEELVKQILRRVSSLPAIPKNSFNALRSRRGSHDATSSVPLLFKVRVKDTLENLLRQEDTDQNNQITILDNGPKAVWLGTAVSDSAHSREIRGGYQLANLLEELALVVENTGFGIIRSSLLSENPVDRIRRKIDNIFWTNLTRRLDESLLDVALIDPKDWNLDTRPRIYVPYDEHHQYNYYSRVVQKWPELNIEVQYLPPRDEITPDFVHSIRDKPGILALGMHNNLTDNTMQGLEFIVPGGRFNECYYWDSYFISLGLLEAGRVELVEQIFHNFVFEIQHYGKIPNANRSYFLTRSQPPFLSDLMVRIFKAKTDGAEAVKFIKNALPVVIKEYRDVWLSTPRYDPISGLSRYRPPGKGIPLEVEQGHFDYVLSKYAKKHGLTIPEFITRFNEGNVDEPELDEFMMHDRAVRESGNDTTYRFESGAANLAVVDLNCLLYKYEKDIAWAIKNVLDDKLVLSAPWLSAGINDGHIETSSEWDARALKRQARVNQYLWNEERGMYFDFNTDTKTQSTFEYVSTFYPLWCGIASEEQAERVVSNALPLFECVGGLSTSTQSSRGEIGPSRPQKQWDYPFGWAPHQMLAWDGLKRYGFKKEMERLIYRWLYIIVKVAVDFNGAIVEKYDVTQIQNASRAVAEYGNQGLDFKWASLEGFGWSNASFSYGLSLLQENPLMVKALGLCIPYDKLKGI
ncbi:hypothetical protein FQN57_001602 [Myotisia sp. PD_48]|nr:hypothetical protein FQN57_001602 [Myotisia sp. PD_48]